MDDLISRQAAIDVIKAAKVKDDGTYSWRKQRNLDLEFAAELLETLPSAQPFHNITMNDVLKYIDGMPEDVWQEFTACLECRGWDLQRRVAKWCGGRVCMSDLIDRQAAIDAVETKIKKWNAVDGEGYHGGLGLRLTDVVETLTALPSAQSMVLTCDGCRHVGTYDTDFPCSGCIRREKDYYEQER